MQRIHNWKAARPFLGVAGRQEYEHVAFDRVVGTIGEQTPQLVVYELAVASAALAVGLYLGSAVTAVIVSKVREQNLRLTDSEESTKIDFMVLLTVQTMNYLHSGRHRVAL